MLVVQLTFLWILELMPAAPKPAKAKRFSCRTSTAGPSSIVMHLEARIFLRCRLQKYLLAPSRYSGATYLQQASICCWLAGCRYMPFIGTHSPIFSGMTCHADEQYA